MTTIILTIIGIILAAAAALMVVSYGGASFYSGSASADANMIQNTGSTVIAAAQMYRADSAIFPSNVNQLLDPNGPTGGYIIDTLTIPAPANMEYAIGSDNKYLVYDVPAAICRRINGNLKISVQPVSVAAATARMSCTTNGTFVARIDVADALIEFGNAMTSDQAYATALEAFANKVDAAAQLYRAERGSLPLTLNALLTSNSAGGVPYLDGIIALPAGAVIRQDMAGGLFGIYSMDFNVCIFFQQIRGEYSMASYPGEYGIKMGCTWWSEFFIIL